LWTTDRDPGEIKMSQGARVDDPQMECVIAALLTIASLGSHVTTPDERYGQVLQSIRAKGKNWYLNPPVGALY
jgi:hypothetical protein